MSNLNAFLRVLLLGVFLVACSDDDDDDGQPQGNNGTPQPGGMNSLVYGVTEDDRLVSFSLDDVGTLLSDIPITGLMSGVNSEYAAGFDLRPSTGQLYIYTNQNNLYTLEKSTGVATLVGQSSLGDVRGFDFDPVTDTIRAVGGALNYRVNPSNANVISQDSDLFYAAGDVNEGSQPGVLDVAYLDHGDGTSTAFVIDEVRDVLAVLGGVGGAQNANSGRLDTVGAIDNSIGAAGGLAFDMPPDRLSAFGYVANTRAISATESEIDLIRVNLTTGETVSLGVIGDEVGLGITGIAFELGGGSDGMPDGGNNGGNGGGNGGEENSCVLAGTPLEALCVVLAPVLGLLGM